MHLGDSKITHIPVDQHSKQQSAKSQSHTGHAGNTDQGVRHFAELVLDELVVDSINNHPVKDLVYANRPINARKIKAQNVFIKNRFQVKGLASRKQNINAVKSKREDGQTKYPELIDEISIDQLIVDGSINGIDLSTIKKFALRVDSEQEQQMKAQFHFSQLKANDVTVKPEVVALKQLENIIRTVGGPYTVLQDVSFAQPLLVNELIIHDSMNNIVSANGKLEVLLKRSPEVQHVSGYKRFETVTLRSPISLQGKISHSNLDHMNPVVTVAKDIVLDGDYVISGNVTIKAAMKCNNLFGASSIFNVKHLFHEGVKVESTEVSTGLDFAYPVKTRSLVTSTINNLPPNDWARVGIIQEVTGRKVFISDLHIDQGFCDALTINGVQFSRINETVLLKTGDQTIGGNIQFRKITLKQYIRSCTNECYITNTTFNLQAHQ